MVNGSTRRAAVSGAFYPASAEKLRGLVEACFRSPLGPGSLPEVSAGPPSRVVGLVAPHAGLVYSGAAAAFGYADLARDGTPETIVLLGPNHRGIGAPIALSAASRWETPLGSLALNQELARALSEALPEAKPDDRAHALEHSLEVQVPFLQRLYGDRVRLLPILLSFEAYSHAEEIGEALAETLEGTAAVVVASSDMSHYVTEETATQQDRYALEAIAALDAGELSRRVAARRITLCGEGPVAAALVAARARGAARGVLNTYYTSGAVTGDTSYVVGYASATLVRED